MQTKKQYGPAWENSGSLIGCRGFLTVRFGDCTEYVSRAEDQSAGGEGFRGGKTSCPGGGQI
jgi:hypothetical protein